MRSLGSMAMVTGHNLGLDTNAGPIFILAWDLNTYHTALFPLGFLSVWGGRDKDAVSFFPV